MPWGPKTGRSVALAPDFFISRGVGSPCRMAEPDTDCRQVQTPDLTGYSTESGRRRPDLRATFFISFLSIPSFLFPTFTVGVVHGPFFPPRWKEAIGRPEHRSLP